MGERVKSADPLPNLRGELKGYCRRRELDMGGTS